MKRFVSIVGAALFTFSAAGTAFAGAAVVTKLEGDAVILRGSEAIPASLGAECLSGDRLVTSPECVADVSLNGLAGCRVLQDTELSLKSTEKADMSLEIVKGNAILNLETLPKDSSFRIETPTAIATVRGTQFWGRVDLAQADNPVTTFAVREGAVDVTVKSLGQTFKLEQGKALDIPKDAAAAPSIRPALEAELKAMEQAQFVKTSA